MKIEILDRRKDKDLECFILTTKIDDVECLFAINKEDNFNDVVDAFIKKISALNICQK